MIENRIPMHRLRQPQFTAFLEDVTHRKIPSEIHIRNFIKTKYNKEITKLTKDLENEYIHLF